MAVISFEEKRRISPTFDGMSFGDVGQYERIEGIVHCDLDPKDPLNSDIVNIDRAPRDKNGLVAYSTEFVIIRPIDEQRGNGWLFYEFINRGTQRGLTRINNAPFAPLPSTAADTGNGFLMRQGFTIVYTAWQGNVEAGGGRLIADFPVARSPDGPCTGFAREEIILDAPDSIRGIPVVEKGPHCFVVTLSYPAAEGQRDEAHLTVRARPQDQRQACPGVSWRFLDDTHIEINVAPEEKWDRGAIYEFTYLARDPVVMGIGYASVRDIVTFLRDEAEDKAGHKNPLFNSGVPAIRHTLGFGLSQSGRVLRDFLYQGFNQSLTGKAVFDGGLAVIAGSRRAWVNAPFSQPGRYSRQHEDHDYPGDQFPFTYQTLHDPLSGRTAGILERYEQTGLSPKIMHLDTESEMWSARASLVATDCEGRDLDLPDNVRLYMTNGVAHGDYPLPSGHVVCHPTNPLTYGSALRALIVAMREWVECDTAPPDNAFPSHANESLVTLGQFQEQFSKVTGLLPPAVMNALHPHTDDNTARQDEGPSYPVFIPAIDRVGNSVGGVRHPLVSVPLGVHAGWSIRAAGFAPGDLYSVYGSYIAFDGIGALPVSGPFSKLYSSQEEWGKEVIKAAEVLHRQRLLLAEDLVALKSSLYDTEDVFHII